MLEEIERSPRIDRILERMGGEFADENQYVYVD